MAQSFSVEETIHRPASEVWEALTDWSNAHQWMPGIGRMQGDGETKTGTVLTFHARGTDRSTTIVHCEDGQSIVLRSIQGGVTADYAYGVHALGERSTRVTLVANCQFTGLWWRMISPLVRLAVRFSDGKQLRLLRALVESR